MQIFINPIALRKAKIVYNFGLSMCSGVKAIFYLQLSLFPDVEVQFLTDLASQHSGPYAVNNICNVLLESKYPKASAAPEATATVTAPVPTASTSSSVS